MDRVSRPITRREALAAFGGTLLVGGVAQGASVRPDATRQSNQQQDTVRAYVGSYHWGYFVLSEDGSERDRLPLSTGDELRLTLFNVEADAAVDALPDEVRENVPSSAERARRNEEAIPVPQGTDLESLHDTAEAAYPDHSLVIVRDEFLGARTGGPGQGPGNGPGQGPGNGPGQGPGNGPGQGPGNGPGQGPGDGPGQGPGLGPWGGHHGPHAGPYGPGSGQGPQGPGGPFGPGSPGGPHVPGMQGHSWWGSGQGVTLAPPVYLWHHATVSSELGFVVNTTGSFGFACTVYCGYGHPYMAERGRVVVTDDSS